MAGSDQYIPDGMDDTMGFSTSPGDEEDQMGNGQSSFQQRQTAGGGNGIADSDTLNETQKLQLAERANEIYRQQLKYMQDHLASLRSLIQDKENIIENLMLRYDLGIITQDTSRQNGNLGADEIEQNELRRKAEALAQRTILENFELREMVNELRDENFHLRNEIYELQDKINRQVLQINKLEKNQHAQLLQQQQLLQQSHDMATGPDTSMNGFGYDADVYEMEEEDPDGQTNMRYHDRGHSITGQDWISNGESTEIRGHKRRESRTEQHPAHTEEAQRKREERAQKHVRKESAKPPDLFEQQSDSDEYMDAEAHEKRKARQNKSRKESVATPDIYGTSQGASEDEEDEEEEDVEVQQTSNKRRGSQVFMDEEALEKRRVRAEKEKHRRTSSIAPPPLFTDGYDPDKRASDLAKKNSPEAIQKRLMRKAKKVGAAAVQHVKSHRRKESLAEKLLLGPMIRDDIDEELALAAKNPEERRKLREKAKKEQRRKSKQFIKSQVGDKGHLSDDDKMENDDKPQRNQLKTRKKLKKAQRANAKAEMDDMPQMTNTGKRPSISGAPTVPLSEEDQTRKHRRDSSSPIVDIGFNDPDVLLHYEQLKVGDLEKELADKIDKHKVLEKNYEEVQQKFEKRDNEATKAKKEALVASRELDEAVDSKASLASKCAMEIMRLTMILNTLQQHPKLKSLVQTLLEESANNTNKNGLL